MAENQTVNKEKRNRILDILSKEYKYENLILMFLAIFAIVLGVLIINKTLTIGRVFLIGSYPMVFAWLLVALGAISLILVVWPFYKPSIVELRRISVPKRSEFLQNIVQVFSFTFILAILFLVFDLGIKALLNLLG